MENEVFNPEVMEAARAAAEAAFWATFAKRGIVVAIIFAFYMPVMACMVWFLDKIDKRYRVNFVENDPTANGLYAGLLHGALIIAFSLVFCDVIKILFL